MRWAVLVVAITACGGEESRSAHVDVPEQPLVIPVIDAGAAPSQTARPVDVDPPPLAEASPSPDFTADSRDPRAKNAPRQRALLDTEIQGLERLLATTPAGGTGASSRPLLLKRLAYDYAEVARGTSGPDALRARQLEIAHWTTLLHNHPTFAGIDEARYYRGLAFELSGDMKQARSSYYDLIKSSPTSRFIPYAYYAFGELFFNEAATDPSKNPLAQQAFMEVLRYPPPNNGMFAFGLLRLGETELRLNEPAKAKANFDRLRREFPNSAAASRIPP